MSEFENMSNENTENEVSETESFETESFEAESFETEDAPVAPEAPEPEFADYDDIPVYDNEAEEEGKKPFAITSLVCGIVSIVCCCIPVLSYLLPIAAIVFGILSLKKEEGRGKGMAIAGIIMGGISGLFIIFSLVFTQVAMGPILEQIEEHPEDAANILQNYLDSL